MTTMTQPLEALTRANEVRLDRADLRHSLKSGETDFAPVILEPPECLNTARVEDVVRALPRIGRSRALDVIAGCSFTAGRRIGELTERQRRELAERLTQLFEERARERARR